LRPERGGSGKSSMPHGESAPAATVDDSVMAFSVDDRIGQFGVYSEGCHRQRAIYLIASGFPGDPVAPFSRSGVKTNANSLTRSRANSAKSRFSSK
jgi:hypothetical protein